MMSNGVLYYPTIEFVDYNWLWQASLIWDRIYRIVPDGYEPNDPANVRALVDSGEIGTPIRPGAYAADVAKEFMTKYESGEWDAAALIDDLPDDYEQLHTDKVDVVLRNMIIAKGSAIAHDEWLQVPTSFAAHYMMYLSNRIADRNNLQVVSDSVPAWTGATYFHYDGGVEDMPNREFTQQLAALVVRKFLPDNILSISVDDLLRFRENYRSERQRFCLAIQRSAKILSECEDASVSEDVINDVQKDIDSALDDFRDAISSLNVVSMTGLWSVTLPVITGLAAKIGGEELSPTNLMALGAGGAALGLVSGLSNLRQQKMKLVKNCDYSYLLSMQHRWKSRAIQEYDYNYDLCRSMEEYIND
jgi:hypothetical protein